MKKEKDSLRSKKCFRLAKNNVANAILMKTLEQLENLQIEYDDIYEELAKGTIIRWKATWYEKGERNDKYFLNLESHNGSKSAVQKIFNGKGMKKIVRINM